MPVSLPLSSPLPATLPVRLLADAVQHSWEHGLELDASVLLKTDRTDVWDELTRRFESRLISCCTGGYAGPTDRGRAKAGHRPQHHHAQDSGAGFGVKSAPSAYAV
jgi:two-component system nitrogen regulation response regulator GlnG